MGTTSLVGFRSRVEDGRMGEELVDLGVAADDAMGSAEYNACIGPIEHLVQRSQFMVMCAGKSCGSSQAKLFHDIKKLKDVKPRESTKVNIGRTQAGVDDYFQLLPSPEAIWKSMRSRDISRNVRDYLWKNMHNAYKLGKSWNNIPNLEQRGLCPTCEVEKSMELLLECDAPGRALVWKLANELWTISCYQKRTVEYWGAD